MTDRLVERFDPVNRDFVAAGVRRRRNEGLRPGSIHGWVTGLSKLDQFLPGKPFEKVSPEELEVLLEQMRQSGLSQSSIHLTAGYIRQALKDLLDVDNLPRGYARALKVRSPPTNPTIRTLSEAEFHRMLEVAHGREGWFQSLPNDVQGMAILWLLWDTGFRAQELLALNVGDVHIEDKLGATISLRPEMPSLKTGPRTIYVSECVGMLHVLLALHPWKDEAKAPLFPGFRQGKAGRMQYMALGRFITAVATESGVNQNSSWDRPVTPHTFRHTCATRKARLGWNEAQLSAYFGWRKGSDMAGHYVHLAAADMRDRVRQDALGSNVSPEVEKLAALLRSMIDDSSDREQST